MDNLSVQGQGAASAVLVRPIWAAPIGDLVFSTDAHRRIRLVQWLVSALAYAGSALVLWFGQSQGWMNAGRLLPWCAFLVVALGFVYWALRSGWSERFEDPALTVLQILIGVAGVEWGYLICGPIRSAALFPLLLIFTYGAFSLDWRKIAWLTALALASLLATVAAFHSTRAGTDIWSLGNREFRMDLTNVLMISIMLPALSFLAARLSSLRSRLHAQRTALSAALLEVQRLATHDALTGLCNRRYMEQRLAEEQSLCERTERPFCLALVDLDHFKQVNDALGHAGGDRVLQAFAAEANQRLRDCDRMARWGGEEFLILMPATHGRQAVACVERFLEQVKAMDRHDGVRLSFSAGVTECRPGETVAQAVARADGGMYAAKRAGRSRVLLV